MIIAPERQTFLRCLVLGVLGIPVLIGTLAGLKTQPVQTEAQAQYEANLNKQYESSPPSPRPQYEVSFAQEKQRWMDDCITAQNELIPRWNQLTRKYGVETLVHSPAPAGAEAFCRNLLPQILEEAPEQLYYTLEKMRQTNDEVLANSERLFIRFRTTGRI